MAPLTIDSHSTSSPEHHLGSFSTVFTVQDQRRRSRRWHGKFRATLFIPSNSCWTTVQLPKFRTHNRQSALRNSGWSHESAPKSASSFPSLSPLRVRAQCSARWVRPELGESSKPHHMLTQQIRSRAAHSDISTRCVRPWRREREKICRGGAAQLFP